MEMGDEITTVVARKEGEEREKKRGREEAERERDVRARACGRERDLHIVHNV
jgi:hypothetical protein